jgi:transposase
MASEAGQALYVLDRFHITQHMNQAVDEVRRAEITRLRAKSKDEARQLKNMRWPPVVFGPPRNQRYRRHLDTTRIQDIVSRTILLIEQASTLPHVLAQLEK